MDLAGRSRRAAADQQNIEGFQAIYVGATQNLTISGTSQESNPVGRNTTVVRLCCDTVCRILIGKDNATTATVDSVLLPANSPELFGINPGEVVAVIGTSGKLSITEGA
jgi:hypothetical protein